MSVIIRRKKIKDGYVSIFLDIHFKGLGRKYEFLGLKFKESPANHFEKEEKKNNWELAKRIALQRETDLITSEYGLDPVIKRDVDFFEFLDDYITNNKGLVDIRCYKSVLSKLKIFTGKSKLLCRDVNEPMLERFSKYLLANHKGETAYNYFKKLKRVIREAVRAKLIRENPCTDIRCPKLKSTEKSVLSFDEIAVLNRTRCGNVDVKRAFLLSCLTGLRFCDIKCLRWKNIKSSQIDIVQQKTKNPVTILLNGDARQIIGKHGPPNDYVFVLPSHNACLKNLKNWVKKAGIDKKITWHCSRHSFGTNLVQQGTDVITASKLLGHTSLKYTTRYVRINEVLKSEAVNKFPQMFQQKTKK